MNTEARDKFLRRLFRDAANNQPLAPGPHVSDDDELITCWSLGQLSPQQHEAFHKHLSDCPRCRQELAGLVRAGVAQVPEPVEGDLLPFSIGAKPLAVPRREEPRAIRRSWTRSMPAFAAIAMAASVLFVLTTWLTWSRGSGANKIIAQAELDLEQNRPDQAIDKLEPLLSQQLDPQSRAHVATLVERSAYRLASQDLATGKLDEVQQTIQRATQHEIRSPRLLNLGLQADRGSPTEIALAPAGTLADYGFTLDGGRSREVPTVDATKVDEWLPKYQAGIADFPSDAILRLNYGQLLLKTGRTDDASRQFSAALAAEPTNAWAHLGLGLVHYQQDQFEEARKHFQAVLNEQRDNLGAHMNLAMTYERLGQADAAKVHWQRARELTADPKLRQQIDEHLARGE
jgi:tetratricopeptide (TPR) repeat protein